MSGGIQFFMLNINRSDGRLGVQSVEVLAHFVCCIWAVSGCIQCFRFNDKGMEYRW